MYERAMNAIKLVGLVGNEKKYPDDLSGGMKQRVALARAIVVEPDVLLLDEPLSALDAKIRKQMQLELKRIHKQLGITFILVTHDQEEALTLSDRIVVMNFGKIMQIGKSNEIYDSPNSAWVANFIGVANVFNGVIKQNTTVECLSIITPYREEDKNIAEVDEQVDVLIRPEDFDVVNENEGFINATVKSILYKGLM
ncbi:ABC transporter ATP-binding protein [bacterium]|nr:ABC transporter ATP-binding protein [bacterium]MBO6023179.1 ABC transporter ATP-binding protein [bacterium]